MWNRKKIILISAAVAAIAVIVLIVAVALRGSHGLKGRWALDEVTSYEFNGSGRGVMYVQSAEYPFTYHIDGDTLSIDFAAEEATDRTYTYSVKNHVLELTAGNQTYQMKKTERAKE